MGAITPIDRATLEGLVAACGVEITAVELDTVARSLVRIQAAATSLLQPMTFDDTDEHFYRLLEDDGVSGAGA